MKNKQDYYMEIHKTIETVERYERVRQTKPIVILSDFVYKLKRLFTLIKKSYGKNNTTLREG